jgi:hypothetical protein
MLSAMLAQEAADSLEKTNFDGIEHTTARQTPLKICRGFV